MSTLQAPLQPVVGPDVIAPPLLSRRGPDVVLGGADPLIGPVSPSRHSLFGPRGAHLFDLDGPLWVADTGHHRLLGWRRTPIEDGQPADWVLGQPDFTSEGRNALGDVSASSLNVPAGVAAWGSRGMAVADSWNNRVLVWFELPTRSGVPADLVLGQADFAGESTNRGRASAGPDTMHWPFQVLVHQGRLYVADAGNRRVLVWRTLPTRNGQPADFALGQPDLFSRSDNGGRAAGPSGMRWPHDLAIFRGNLVVTDAGNNRVLMWDGLPDASDAPAARVLGQDDFEAVDHNQASYWPDAACLNMPYAVAADREWILAADTANSRLLGWHGAPFDGAPAQALTGQAHFSTKGDNRWQAPVRDSLCWPYGLQVIGRQALICDTGNHRVLMWTLYQELG